MLNVSNVIAGDYDKFLNMTKLDSDYLHVMRYLIQKVGRVCRYQSPFNYFYYIYYNIVASSYLIYKMGISSKSFQYILSIFGFVFLKPHSANGNIKKLMKPWAVNISCSDRIKFGA